MTSLMVTLSATGFWAGNLVAWCDQGMDSACSQWMFSGYPGVGQWMVMGCLGCNADAKFGDDVLQKSSHKSVHA